MKHDYLNKFGRYVNLVWLCLFLVFWVQFANGASALEAGTLSLVCVLITYPFTTYLSGRILKKAVKNRRFFLFGLQFLGISALIALLFIGVFVLFNYLEEINVFSKSLMFEGESNFLNDFIGPLFAVSMVNFGFCGMRFFEENLKMQKAVIESQLQILQAQINPHFMFNVLNHVHVLIRREPDLADTLLLQYTDILRYQLYSGKKEHTPIEQEVQFLKNFIDVEKVRWKNKLDIHCTWNVENKGMEFPPLLLITFIENAFKHVSRPDREKGYVKIDLEQQGKTVCLTVENSHSETESPKKEDSGIGLINIRKRLDILFPGKYRLEITRNDTMYSTELIINL